VPDATDKTPTAARETSKKGANTDIPNGPCCARYRDRRAARAPCHETPERTNWSTMVLYRCQRNGGRGVFIAGAPPARDGVEFQYFGATVSASRLEAIAKLAADGKLRMPIGAQFPLERAGEAMEQVSALHTVGRVVLRIGS
jgi:hypothetical protein